MKWLVSNQMTWFEFVVERRRLEGEKIRDSVYDTFRMALRRNRFKENQTRRILRLARKLNGKFSDRVRGLLERRIIRLRANSVRLRLLARKKALPKPPPRTPRKV